MKHPHFDLIVEWAKDTSRVVQCRSHRTGEWNDCNDVNIPGWLPSYEYRFKPEPKPDVVFEGLFGLYGIGSLCYHVSSAGKPNLRLTFDGETGKLKSAEVL